MPSRAGRGLPLLLALALLILAALPALPASAATAEAVKVTAEQATATFPTRISFTLSADTQQPVTAAETRYRAAYSQFTESVPATVSGGTHLDLSTSVDMQTHYLPPGVEIQYHWLLTLADGTTVETPVQSLLYMDTQHNWQHLTQGQVTLYYYAGSQQFGQQMVDTVTQAIQNLKSKLQVTADEPVHVVVFGSNSELAAALPPNSAEWIGGFANPELHLIVTGIAAGDTREVQRILSHESVHLITGQATENPYNAPPPWLDEGLASYYQTVSDPRLDQALQSAVRNGTLISLPALNASFPDDPNQALLSYGESRSIVQYIIEQLGQDKMTAMLNAFRDGVSYEQDVEIGLGMTQQQLDAAWKAWLGYKGDNPAGATGSTGPSGPSIPPQALIDAVLLVTLGGSLVVLYFRRRARSAT